MIHAKHPQLDLMLAARALARQMIGRDGVIGVDVGTKYKDEAAKKGLAIRFFVDQKVADTALKRLGRHKLPRTVVVAGKRVHTDVLVARPIPHYVLVDPLPTPDQRKQVMDPIQPGCSIGARMGDAGTLGMIVYDRDTGAPLALSNWHVLDLGGGVGADIHQPGPLDETPSAATLVGPLLRSHRGFAGDCAVAKIANRRIDASVLGIGVTPSRIADPEHGDVVIKSGRTSGVTVGQVEGVGLTMTLAYAGANVRLGGVLTIQPLPNAGSSQIAAGGDSGSLWLAMDQGQPSDIAMALHFGGDEQRNVAYACLLRPIMTKLRLLTNAP